MSDKHMKADPTWAVVPEPDRPGDVPCLCRDGDGVAPRWREDSQLWHLRVGGMVYGVSRRARDVVAGALGLVDAGHALPDGVEWPRVDGEPVAPGDVLWDEREGWSFTVDRVVFSTGGARVVGAGPGGSTTIRPDAWGLTRTEPHRPVLDRCGREIEPGEAVWGEDGLAWLVTGLDRGKAHSVVATRDGETRALRPEWLTHERPDSWGRLEADAAKGCCGYFGRAIGSCKGCPALRATCEAPDCSSRRASDVVRRAKALAGVAGDA